MTTTMIELSQLREAADNPNRMEPAQFAKLVAFVRDHGFLQPILVTKRGDGAHDIVDGHHRFRAAQECGLQAIPCVEKAVTEEQRKLLQVGFNKLRGDLDLSLVANAFSQLSEAGIDPALLEATGFTSEEVDALLRAAQDEPDVMPASVGPADEPEADVDAPLHVLELAYADKGDYQRARKALRRAAGQDGDLGAGLLKLLDEGA